MASIEDILGAAEDPAYQRVVTVSIPLIPQALRDEHAHLDALLPTLVTDTIDAHPDRLPTAQRLAEIEAEIEERSVTFRFKSIGNRAWSDLLRTHPPTRAQLSQHRGIDHNPETFPYAAIAASCVDPVMTSDDVKRLDASTAFDVTAWNDLWGACLRANVAEANPKSQVAGLILRLSAGSATTAALEDSLAPSFSGES